MGEEDLCIPVKFCGRKQETITCRTSKYVARGDDQETKCSKLTVEPSEACDWSLYVGVY